MPTLPKYFSISQEIIRQIKSGALSPGMKAPSENTIIRKYRVSNTTARKALQEIEKLGWTVKIKGKGSVVRSTNIVRSANRILSFTNNMIEAGYAPSTKVLDRGILPAGYAATVNGRRYTMKGPVYRISRLRFGDDIPMMMEVRYISLALCPGIAEEKLESSLYRIYERRYGLQLTEIHQMLSTIMMSRPVMKLFNVDEPIPCIEVEGVTFCGRELILEMEKSIYRGDKYRFAVRAISRSS